MGDRERESDLERLGASGFLKMERNPMGTWWPLREIESESERERGMREERDQVQSEKGKNGKIGVTPGASCARMKGNLESENDVLGHPPLSVPLSKI